MPSLYARWMYGWETRLTSVDNNRVVRPLEWGIEWTRDWPCRNGFLPHQTQAECERYLLEYNARAVAASERSTRKGTLAQSAKRHGVPAGAGSRA